MIEKIVTIGSDSELFVTKDGKISSFAGVLGYDKDHKLDLGTGVRLQEDNVLLEFDIDPCGTLAEFNQLMGNGINGAREVALSHGYNLAEGVASHNYSAKELYFLPETAKVFGCQPDLNALTGLYNPVPEPKKGLRTAGGHIHIGYIDHIGYDNTNDRSKSKNVAGVLCDFFLGIPSLLEDEDDRRKELYGKAGAIRSKDYGIEYRTLSNYWIKDYRDEVWARTQKVVDVLKNQHHTEIFSIINPSDVQAVINNNDKVMAEQYLKILETL
jgi:hypothetical protein